MVYSPSPNHRFACPGVSGQLLEEVRRCFLRPIGLPTNFHELHSETSQPLPTGAQHLEGLHQITPHTILGYFCPPGLSTDAKLIWVEAHLTSSDFPAPDMPQALSKFWGVWMGGHMDGWVDGLTEGWRDGWVNGQMGGCFHVCPKVNSVTIQRTWKATEVFFS